MNEIYIFLKLSLIFIKIITVIDPDYGVNYSTKKKKRVIIYKESIYWCLPININIYTFEFSSGIMKKVFIGVYQSI